MSLDHVAGWSFAKLRQVLGIDDLVVEIEQSAPGRAAGELAKPLTFAYAADLLDTITDNDAETVTFNYDGEDRVSTIENTLTNLKTTITYTAGGQVSTIKEAAL